MKRFSVFLLTLLALAGCNQGGDNSTNNGGGPPTITAVIPSTVLRGQTIEGRIQGSNFNGVGVVNMGDGIRVIEITAVATQEIQLRYFVNNDAAPGARTISVTTSAGTATNTSLLSVGGNRAPHAQFSVDPTVGISQTLFTFDATGSSDEDGTVTGYNWDFGDGRTEGGKKVTHKFSSHGKFNVKLTVTDNDQGQTIASRELEVKNGKLPIARFDVTPAEGDTTTMFRFDGGRSSDPDGRIVEYDWIFGDGGRKKGKIAEHRFRSPELHDVTLIVTDNDKLESETGKNVRVRGTPPVANFTVSPEQGDFRTPFRFDGTSSFDRDGSVTSYQWNFGDGTTGSGAIIMHTFPRAATFQVQLTVTDNGGARASTQRNFRVFEGDDPGPGPGPGPGPSEGRCTTPSRLREPFLFTVVSEDRASKTIVGRFHEQVTCSQVFYLCGDVRLGGIRPGDKEYWIGVICEMYSLGDNEFRIHLRDGNSWVDVGESGTYVWPQFDCNPAVTCN
jgi:PKD repeat protein